MIVVDSEIAAKYDILAEMSPGGMGLVYKVRHKLLGDERVIKIGKFVSTKDKERFIREAKRGYLFRHDNIAKVLDFDITVAGTAYIVMEFIAGASLLQMLGESKKAFRPPRAIDIAVQTLSALQYLHERGVVHRDISPDNIMLTEDESGKPLVKLIDLGIAKSVEATQNLTKDGMFIGKFKYASPEQFRGKFFPTSDLYSLGVVMFELLTGALPIRSTDQLAAIAAHVIGDLRGFDEVDPDERVPYNLRSVVMRALQKEPVDRFQTAAEFAEALRSLSTAVILEPTLEVPVLGEVIPSRSEQIAWDAAMASDSPRLWDEFLTRYPDSARSDSARARREELEQIDEKDWEKAVGTDTEDAWNTYLELHPESPRASHAQRRRDDRLAWEATLASGTTSAFQSFIQNHPDSPRIADARAHLAGLRQREAEEADWAIAKRADESVGWQFFLSHYPQSRHIKEAEQNLATALYREKEIRDWEAAKKTGSIESWQSYLQVHSDSARRGKAEELLAVLRQEADEEKEWSAATAANTSKGWRAYLQRFSESHRAAAAERELKDAEERENEQLDWDVAAAIDTSYGWQAYLTKHPDGRAGMAQQRLAAANEAVAWTAAEKNGSSAAWRQFLDEFGASRRAAEAEKLLAAAEWKENSERAFEAAEKAGTTKAWREFLALYEATPLAANARLALDLAREKETEREAYAEADLIDTVASWTSFVDRFPSSPRIGAARKRLARAQERLDAQRRAEEARLAAEEEAAWSQAASLRTIEGWENYLANWSSSNRFDEAKARLTDARVAAARDEAIKQGTVEALERFLKAYPRSDYAPEVQKIIDQIRAEERAKLDAEHRAWSGTNRNSIAEIKTFINNYPTSPRVTEARNLIDTLSKREADVLRAAEARAWRAAVKANTTTDYEAFVSDHPESRHVAEARQRIGDIDADEKRAWSVAQKRNTIAAYEKFIKSHPWSTYVGDANRRINALRIPKPESVVERVAARVRKTQAGTATTHTARIPFSPAWPSRTLGWVTMVLIVTGLAAGGYFLQRPITMPTNIPTPVTATAPPVVSTLTGTPEVSAGTGRLVINALPWGEVKSLKDETTNTERIKAGQPLYTPATLNLPAGSYKVILSNPNSGKSAPCSVIVKAAQTVKCEAIVDTVDPNEYLGALTVSGQ
jgi:serine/threonine-protein kinase